MKQILGIDVGGTKIAAGLVDRDFKVRKVAVLPTSHKDLVGQLERLIRDYEGFDGIGLALPGQVLPNGTVRVLANIKSFKSTNLRKVLEKKFKVPVCVINDAKAFALAEALIGSGKDFQTVAGIILGTGIGVGVVMDKKVYFGADGLAGEIGQFPMPDGKVLEKYVKEAGRFVTGVDAAKYLKLLISYLVLSFNPETIVLGGGWSKIPRLDEAVKDALKKLTYPTKTKVFVSKMRHAGIIGAVLALKK